MISGFDRYAVDILEDLFLPCSLQHLAFEGGFNQSFESVKFPQRPLIAIHVWWAKKGWRQEREQPSVGEARKYVGENQCVKAATLSLSLSFYHSISM